MNTGKGKSMAMLALLVFLPCFAAVPSASAAPGWLAPVDLSAPLHNANRVDIAMDDAGDLVAVWDRDGAPLHPVQASVRPAGGDYSAPVDLADTGSSSNLAMTPAGGTIVVYAQLVSGKHLVRARIRSAGGSFSPPIDVGEYGSSSPGSFSVDPRVAVDPAGDAAFVWLDQTESQKSVVMASTMPAGGAPSNAVPLSDESQSAFGPQVAVDAAGKATVVWSGYSADWNRPTSFRFPPDRARPSRPPRRIFRMWTGPTKLSLRSTRRENRLSSGSGSRKNRAKKKNSSRR